MLSGEVPHHGYLVANRDGGFLISPLPITPLKPGSATFPFPGVVPKILRENGSECQLEEGVLWSFPSPGPGC